jgi:hypothetical protein
VFVHSSLFIGVVFGATLAGVDPVTVCAEDEI